MAEYWQFYKNPQESWKNTTTAGQEAAGYSKLVCPHYVSDPDVEVYLVFANTDAKDVVVNVRFHDDNGREVGKARQLVKANGKTVVLPWEVIKNKATGVAFITTDGGRGTGARPGPCRNTSLPASEIRGTRMTRFLLAKRSQRRR